MSELPDIPAIAVVSKQRLIGATNGSSAYLLAIVSTLTECGFAVHLIQPSPAIAGRSPVLRLRPEMGVFASHSIRGACRLGSWVIFLAPSIWMSFLIGAARLVLRKAGLTGSFVADRPAPYAVATPWFPADEAFLRSALPPSLRAIIADYMFCSPAFEHAPAHIGTAIVMHDLFHARAGGEADSVAMPSRELEIALLGRAGTVFAIQEAEKSFLMESVPHTNAVLVPMPARTVSSPQPGNDDEVLFVGSNTAPNVVGLEWFLSEVWPLVLALRPQARLNVAGTVNRALSPANLSNVSLLGMVDDLEPLYSSCGVVISPLTFGSGLKIKLIEAMARGKAMVVTPVTLQGVEAVCRDSVIETEDPAEFAGSLATLLADKEGRTNLAAKALECANRNFTSAQVHAGLREWCQHVRG